MIKMPTILATTIGIELTYIPAVFDELRKTMQDNELEGADVIYKELSDFGMYGYSKMMGAILNKRSIAVSACKTDPGCVEIPTLPMQRASVVRKTIKDITTVAAECALYPTAWHTIGGGAHIHTGLYATRESVMAQNPDMSRWQISDKVQEINKIYALVLQVWLTKNPWFAWAFAGCADFANAQTITREQLSNRGDAGSIPYLEEQTKRYSGMARCERLEYYRNIKLGRPNYNNDYTYYRSEFNSYRARLAQKRAEIAAAGISADYKTVDELNAIDRKQYAIVQRDYTMEFRGFIMPKKLSGHETHIAIVDKIVRYARDETQAMIDTGIMELDMRGSMNKKEMAKLTLKDSLKGFKKMVEGFGFSYKDFYTYRYNMMLRFKVRKDKGEEL